MSKGRAGNRAVSNGPYILKQENSYVKWLEINVLQICASMYTWIEKYFSWLVNEVFPNKFWFPAFLTYIPYVSEFSSIYKEET